MFYVNNYTEKLIGLQGVIVKNVVSSENSALRCSEWVSDFNELKSLCIIAIETMLNPKIAKIKYTIPLPVEA